MVKVPRPVLLVIATLLLLLPLFRCSSDSSGKGLEISCRPDRINVFQGEKVNVVFSITNHMTETIRPKVDYFISYHLYDSGGNSVAYDNPRYAIPRVLRRNKTVDFELPLFFGYPKAGDYRVEFDIVKEGKFWGSHKKWKTASVDLHLKPLTSDEFKTQYPGQYIDTGNPLFDNQQYLLRVTYKNCQQLAADGTLFGFAAGSDYPQVWIRDTATFIRYAKQFYDVAALGSTLERFLRHQSPKGEIVDWIDMSGHTDKNTVETDQESSLVLAAREIAIHSPQWLNKTMEGASVLDRLEQALEWVWMEKRHPKYQLIQSGFTADWGDNENTFADQKATKLSNKSTMVLGIYTQSKYIQAIQALLEMFRLIPDNAGNAAMTSKIKLWQQRLETLKTETVKQLYLEDKGYFLVHLVPNTHDGDDKKEKYFRLEQDILAVGGNAEAIIAGLMDKAKIQRFVQVLEQRRQEYKLRTVSFTLLPPYPEGFFPHHLLKHPWNYQNGGEWDWIGGRVVKGLYLYGFKEKADQFLTEIVEKNLRNFCIYEWEDRTGTGRGALFYVGAAGVIGDALLVRSGK